VFEAERRSIEVGTVMAVWAKKIQKTLTFEYKVAQVQVSAAHWRETA
jgi:hypothetical protein